MAGSSRIFSAGGGKRSLLTCSQEEHLGTSMVAQGLRLSMQGAQVQSLVRELRFPHTWGPKTKIKNRNNIVTNSMKTLKTVHIKKKKKGRASLLGAPDPDSAGLPPVVRWAFWSPQGRGEPTDLPFLTRLEERNAEPGSPTPLAGRRETPHPYVVPLALGLQTRWLLYHSPFRVLFCLLFVLFMDLQLYFLGMSR